MAVGIRLSALGVVLFGVSAAACAGLIDADFGDVRGGDDGGAIAADSGHVIQPGDDSGNPVTTPDSGPIIVADGGVCPTTATATYTDCSGVCYDLNSDANNCRTCGAVCANDPHGPGVCLSGSCTFACRGGYVLCATASDGCCAVTTTGADASTDSGPVQSDLGIPCASTYCAVNDDAGSFCCGNNQSSPPGDFCASNASSDLECTYAFSCGSAGDCPASNRCCYDTNPYDPEGDQNGESSFCEAECTGGEGAYIQFCNPSATGECTGTTTCTGLFDGNDNDLMTTYHYCK
jgi:hypothetical protein